MSKNITIISPNFWPEDTAIGLYNTQLSKLLTDNQYKVTVITAFPYYPQWSIYKAYKSKPFLMEENFDGIRILRSRQYIPSNPTFFKRILHLLSFTFGCVINLFKTSKPDIVISIVPFTTTILLGSVLKFCYGSKLWVHIQDFEFDAANQTGYGSKLKTLFKGLYWIEKKLINQADVASTISQSMIKMLEQKTETTPFFLPNWIDENIITPNNYSQHQFLKSNKTKILYSGNIGQKQDWNIFLNFCKDIDPTQYQIIVVGDGAKKKWLMDQISLYNHVECYPPVPFMELSDLLCSTDFHILFQKTEVIDTVMPSKILGMMASGRPSIIIGNKNSEVKKTMEDSKGGLYFNHYSKAIINKIEQLTTNPSKRLQMGGSARNYVISNFSSQEIFEKVLNKMKTLQ